MLDLDKSKEQIPDNLPIHTMLGDLDALEHPEKIPAAPIEKIAPAPIINRPPEIQKTGPFSAPPSDKIEIKKNLPETKNKFLEVPKKEGALATNVGKLIAAVLVILMISALGVSGYYFWNPRSLNPEPAVKIPVEPTPESTPEPTPTPAPKFTTEKANTFSIDLTSASPADMQTSLSGLIEEVKKENLSGSVEFILADKDSNPVTFQNFSQKLGLGFSKNLISSLDKNFSLFVFNDSGNYRLGLAIDYKKGFDLKKLMQTEEPTLLAKLKPLFLNIQYVPVKNMRFSESAYGKLPVRFENIVSPEYLSIDYIVGVDKLFIGTTKMTARAIADLKERQANEAPAIPK